MKTLIKELAIIVMFVIIGLVAEKFDIWNPMILIMLLRVYIEIVWRGLDD